MLDVSTILPRRLVALVEEDPDAVLQQETTGARETRAELSEAVLRWAAAYRAHGVVAGDAVATMLPNGLQVAHAWLGAAWLRAIESPANTMYQGPMLSYFLNNTRARILVVGDRFLPQLAAVESELESLELVVVVGAPDPSPLSRIRCVAVQEFLDGVAPATDLEAPGLHDIACMIYTSGTTGPSKGVLVPWREMYEYTRCLPPDAFADGGTYYTATPMFHVSGRGALAIAVNHGVKTMIREKFSVSSFWPEIERFDINVTFLLGAMANMLLRQPRESDPASSPLKTVIMGPLVADLAEFNERFDARVVTSYGMTEIGLPLYADAAEVPDLRTCGRPQAGYKLRVVDDHDQPLGPGVVGELLVRTDEPWMLNAGYWNRPDATADAWRNGWFHTGDGFRYDEDGYYYFSDRIKDALRRRGENISSFEVEALVNSHPDVVETAAIGVPSTLTEDDLKIVVIVRPEAELAHAELYAYLVDQMPQFMLPRYIEFATDWARTHTGRTKKVELRKAPFTPQTWDQETGAFIV